MTTEEPPATRTVTPQEMVTLMRWAGMADACLRDCGQLGTHPSASIGDSGIAIVFAALPARTAGPDIPMSQPLRVCLYRPGPDGSFDVTRPAEAHGQLTADSAIGELLLHM
jgi:hypothetical protein